MLRLIQVIPFALFCVSWLCLVVDAWLPMTKGPLSTRMADDERFGRRRLLPDQDDVDDFLDTPFYDPDTVLEDEESSDLSRKFASFVKNNADTAEALIAGLYLSILVIVSQELLRMQLYGDDYVPFAKGGGGGFL